MYETIGKDGRPVIIYELGPEAVDKNYMMSALCTTGPIYESKNSHKKTNKKNKKNKR